MRACEREAQVSQLPELIRCFNLDDRDRMQGIPSLLSIDSISLSACIFC